MSTEVVMPQMGESIAEGTITKWHKKAGDAVERDEPLFEITTDKVDTEVPSPVSGTLTEILVQQDETVAVGTVVGVVLSSDEASRAPTKAAPPPEAATDNSPDQEAKPSAGHFKSAHETTLFERKPLSAASPKLDGDTTAPTPAPVDGARSTVVSPVVAALAAKHALPMDELTAIPGSGRGGRVTKKDVLAYVEARPQAPRSAPAGAPATTSLPSTPSALVYRPEPEDELVPMSAVGKQIAEQLMWSRQISAPVTSFSECDMHRVERLRAEQGAEFESETGIPLTFMPFVARACVRALKEFPIFGASVVGDQIAMKKRVHLGIATSIEGGLIAPVIKHADEMNFTGLARAIQSLTDKARAGALSPEDVQGATFTITDPGMFGGLTGTPMIPQPQVAILGLGAVSKKPVVIDDAIAIRPVMVLALTFDHRIIDGPTGFQFLERIRIQLEQADPPMG